MHWQTFVSSYLQRAAWEGGTLFADFKGTVCQYEGVSLELWLDLLSAPSKGQWAHQHLHGRPYVIVS